MEYIDVLLGAPAMGGYVLASCFPLQTLYERL